MAHSNVRRTALKLRHQAELIRRAAEDAKEPTRTKLENVAARIELDALVIECEESRRH